MFNWSKSSEIFYEIRSSIWKSLEMQFWFQMVLIRHYFAFKPWFSMRYMNQVHDLCLKWCFGDSCHMDMLNKTNTSQGSGRSCCAGEDQTGSCSEVSTATRSRFCICFVWYLNYVVRWDNEVEIVRFYRVFCVCESFKWHGGE